MSRPSRVNKALDAVEHLSLRTKIRHLCAEQLGSGQYRDVFVLKQDRRFVVKIERDFSTGEFANASEWRNYINNRDDWFIRGWLAPIAQVTLNSQILVMRRARHGAIETYPRYIPAWLTDCKRTNYGFIGSRFVCCDYSFLTRESRRMKRARWWEL